MSYHVTPAGRTGKCRVTTGTCPYGGETGVENHYETEQEARRAYEKTMESKKFFSLGRRTIDKVKAKRRLKRFAAVGGALALSFTVTACGNSSEDAYTPNPYNKAIQEANERGNPTAYSKEGYREKSLKEKVAEKVAEAANRGAGDAIDKVSEVGSKAKEVLEEVADDVSKGEGVGQGSDVQVGQPNPKQIYFQGKPLGVSPQEVAGAKSALEKIPVQELSGSTAYDREGQFGDFQKGTVSRIEKRDIPNGAFAKKRDGLRAVGGSFIDPYTGKKVTIVEGDKNDADVDHIVPLHEVAKSGGLTGLSKSERVQIANDPQNLILVGSKINRSKGDADPASFVPPYEPAQCTYAVKYITVKANYRLTMDPREKQALSKVLATRCS